MGTPIRLMLDSAARHASISVAERTSRRSFVGRLGRGLVALAGGSVVAAALSPERAEAYHICGHIYTTGSCPHPFYPHTRVDRYGYPVHPEYGYPVDDNGDIYVSRLQTRRKICPEVVPEQYPHTGSPKNGGGWSRCCGKRIRRIVDCCSYSRSRINGDGSLVGYCRKGRRVFCIMYRDTDVKC